MKPFGEQRTNRTIGHAAGQNFFGRRAAFAFQETAGKLTGCRQSFTIIDLHREEIDAGTRSAGLHGDEECRFTELNCNRCAGLLGELSGGQLKRPGSELAF